jgi:hypothetical protein
MKPDKYEVQRVLNQAEEMGVLQTVRDRAACGEWPQPATPGDYLAYIADEAEVQLGQALDVLNDDGLTDEAWGLLVHARNLREIVERLTWFGVEPAKLPWESCNHEWAAYDASQTPDDMGYVIECLHCNTALTGCEVARIIHSTKEMLEAYEETLTEVSSRTVAALERAARHLKRELQK